jgi:hypothetical protein
MRIKTLKKNLVMNQAETQNFQKNITLPELNLYTNNSRAQKLIEKETFFSLKDR